MLNCYNLFDLIQ